jgi:uracil DNA glycosylase superfamily protein
MAMRMKGKGTFGTRVLEFYRGLRAPRVPPGIVVMNPYRDAHVASYVRAFLDTYFADSERRVLVFGINPGRFGAGITGVTFTDPVALADLCGIPNDFQRRRELSSIFVYDFVARFGGVREFYRRFFLTAACPLGFTRGGTNLNYYDVPELARAVSPFIVRSIEAHIALGGRRDHAIVLGKGANLTFLQRLNDRHHFFQKLHGLEHPRPIMQYRRKLLEAYLSEYEKVFRSVCGRSS